MRAAWAASLLVLLTTCGCGWMNRPAVENQPEPPPDASRPRLKTRAELAAQREALIRAGKIKPAPTPTVAAEARPQPAAPPTVEPPKRPTEHSIRSDVLMVNGQTLSVAEVLYPLRDWVASKQAELPPARFARALRERLRRHVPAEVGTLLVYEKALAQLPEQRKEVLDKLVERRVAEQVARDFGGSDARFEEHLHRHGLTLETYRQMVKRQLLAQSYAYDLFSPQIHIRRSELLSYYREHIADYSQAETREFLLIAAPYARFLPEGTTWQRASRNARAAARLKAKRHIQKACEELGRRSFAEVAREYSLGGHARDGGSWGQIGLPLKKPPYDELSARIFRMRSGEYTQPIKTDVGWFIVGCGRIEPAVRKSFAEVQDEIRDKLEQERFDRSRARYMAKLAQRATISNMQPFIERAVEQVVTGRWPPRPVSQ